MTTESPLPHLEVTCPPEGTWRVGAEHRMSTYTGLVTFQLQYVDPIRGDVTRRIRRRISVSFPFPSGHVVRPPPSPLPSGCTSQLSPLYSGGGGGWRNWVNPISSSPSAPGGRFVGDYVRESVGVYDPGTEVSEDDPEIEIEVPSSFLALIPDTPAVEDQGSTVVPPEGEDTSGTIP